MSNRIRNIELEDSISGHIKPDVVAPLVEHIAELGHTTRQAAAQRACQSIGINWPSTYLPPGTALWQNGVDTLRSDRKSWARLPSAANALPAVREALAAEDRRDFEAGINTLRLDPATARLVRAPDLGKRIGLGYDKSSFNQLTRLVPEFGREAPRGFANAMLHLDNDLRAETFNRKVIAHEKLDGDGQLVLLRTKISTNGQRVLRAALTEKYADVNDIHVAEALGDALNGDVGTAKLDYRPGDQHSQFEVLYPSEIPVELFKVGDVHKAVILISNSETGHGSIRVRPGVVRARCANMTLAYGFGVEVSFRHIGDADRVKAQLKAAIAQAAAQVEPLVAAIAQSARVALPKDKTPGDMFAAIARKFGQTRDVVASWRETFEGKYLGEYGANLWSVTSAITDAAQSATNWWAQQEQEEVAAELLAKQWVVLA